MKVSQKINQIKIEGDLEIKPFEIEFDRHMVKILSDQLYKHKALAIVRELSTNARDSHVEAGRADTPFDVHLPTWADPTFYIRDYGTGLSPERINNVYRKYGKSDRQFSNVFVGCMGLGSKTPFCYHTKSFTVDSWCGGMHYQYACFLDGDGMPQITLLSSQQSADPSGLKVTLAVNSNDRDSFLAAARDVYRFFDVVPNMTGTKVDIVKPKYSQEGSNWKLDLNSGKMRVIMGGVSYPVDVYSLGTLSSEQRAVVDTGFHVFANIGEVSPIVSREALDYTNRTKTHIRGFINTILKEVGDKITEEISTSKNMLEARRKFKAYNRIVNSLDITYDGKNIIKNSVIDFVSMIRNGDITIMRFYGSNSKSKPYQFVNNISIDSTEWYINDLDIGSISRCNYESRKCQKPVYLFNIVDQSRSQAIKKSLVKLIGCDDTYFKTSSSLPKPPKATAARRGNVSRVVEFNAKASSSYSSYHWDKETDKELKDGGVYIEFNRFSVRLRQGDTQFSHPNDLKHYIDLLKKFGVSVPAIYGIKTADISKVQKLSGWTHLWDWFIDSVKKLVAADDGTIMAAHKAKQTLDDLSKTRIRSRYNSGYKFSDSALSNYVPYVHKDTKFAAFVKEVNRLHKIKDLFPNAKEMVDICSVVGVKLKDANTHVSDLCIMESELYTHYKLLSTLAYNGYSSNSVEHFAMYVNAVDGL